MSQHLNALLSPRPRGTRTSAGVRVSMGMIVFVFRPAGPRLPFANDTRDIFEFFCLRRQKHAEPRWAVERSALGHGSASGAA